MSLLLSPLKELLSSSFPGKFMLDTDWDISRVPRFGGQGERGHSSTVSPLDLLYTRTRYAKGYLSPSGKLIASGGVIVQVYDPLFPTDEL
jgi:hypothetical protein